MSGTVVNQNPGNTFQWSVGFNRPKTGYVGVFPPGTTAGYSVSTDWVAFERKALSSAHFTNTPRATVTLTAPGVGTYPILIIVPADGGQMDDGTLDVTPRPGSAGSSGSPAVTGLTPSAGAGYFVGTDRHVHQGSPTGTGQPDTGLLADPSWPIGATASDPSTLASPAPSSSTGSSGSSGSSGSGSSPSGSGSGSTSTTPVYNPFAPPGGPVYSAPSPEPKASDGAQLSQQGADVQAYYVANYGPGMLAATAFVIDHEHQLAAIGTATTPPAATTVYTKPPNEPAASDGETLSMQPPDTQAYYVNKYGPGFLAAVGYVNERNASLGTSIPGGAPVVFPTGDLGGGGSFSTGTGTPTVPDQRQTGAPPPSVGGILTSVESSLTGNPLLLAAGAAVALLYFMGGKHRR